MNSVLIVGRESANSFITKNILKAHPEAKIVIMDEIDGVPVPVPHLEPEIPQEDINPCRWFG